MTQNSEVSMPMPATANQTICSNCHSAMPSDLRFCRNCGFRLADAMGGLYRRSQYRPADRRGVYPRKKTTSDERFVVDLHWLAGLFHRRGRVHGARGSGSKKRSSVCRARRWLSLIIGIDEFNNTERRRDLRMRQRAGRTRGQGRPGWRRHDSEFRRAADSKRRSDGRSDDEDADRKDC